MINVNRYIFGRNSSAVNPYLANLVYYPKFDSNSNDFSGNGHNGTDTGVSYANTGKVGNSATFNGSTSKIIVPQSTDFDFSGTFSISMWVKHNSVGSTQWIIGKRNGTTRQWQVIFDATYIYLYLFTDGSNYRFARNNDPLSNGVWNHFVITFDLTNIIIYFNGTIASGTSQVSVGTYTGMPISSQAVNIGVLDSIGALYLNGEIDDTYIYKDRVLTSTEALDVFNKGISGIPLI